MTQNRFRNTAIAIVFTAGTMLAASNPAFAGSKSGTFKGDSGHVTTGGVTVDNGVIKLQGNFDFDGAPDPRIGLGKNGKFVAGTDFAVLKKNKGAQTYKIPANLKDSGFDTIYVWCRKFSVPLGHAKLK